jgi:diguanylate cyclase (GGDEF)-like protein
MPGIGLLPRSKEEHKSEKYAFAIAENIRKRIQGSEFTTEEGKPYVHHDKEGKIVPLTVSVGLAEYNLDDSMSDFRKKADDALYEAKKSGRNRVLVHKGNPEAMASLLNRFDLFYLGGGEK